VEILQKFADFSEYMNFTTMYIIKKNMTHSTDASKHSPITLLFCFGVVMLQLYVATTLHCIISETLGLHCNNAIRIIDRKVEAAWQYWALLGYGVLT
jgi:hypothetical protein